MRREREKMVCALAIGGLDPGGGAGVLADLRGFAAAGAFGCAAVALITVQSTNGLTSARPLPPREVIAQASEVLLHQRVRAIKVGALGSRENVRAVATLLAAHGAIPAIVDTPMLPTRGAARLLSPRALDIVRHELLPRAALVTVNVAEAEALLATHIRTLPEARDAAAALVRMGARAALVKGGHLEGESAVDVLAIGERVVSLRAKRIALGPAHGTGCTFASLVAGHLARAPRPSGDAALLAALRWAKRAHHAALEELRDVGGKARVVVFR